MKTSTITIETDETEVIITVELKTVGYFYEYRAIYRDNAAAFDAATRYRNQIRDGKFDRHNLIPEFRVTRSKTKHDLFPG